MPPFDVHEPVQHTELCLEGPPPKLLLDLPPEMLERVAASLTRQAHGRFAQASSAQREAHSPLLLAVVLCSMVMRRFIAHR